jgi:hypothetical protein
MDIENFTAVSYQIGNLTHKQECRTAQVNMRRFKYITSIPSSGLLRGVRWFDTDVSGVPIGPIFTLEDGIGNPKTSVSNHLTLRNNPEAGRLQFNHCESLQSRKFVHFASS